MKLQQTNRTFIWKFLQSPSSVMTGVSTFLLFTLVMGIAFFVRLPYINSSFWLDEAAQAIESTRPFSQQLQLAEDFQPPLIHLIVHFAAYIAYAEWWLRIFGAFIPGLVSIWFATLIVKKVMGFKEAVWIGLFLATNSLHVFFSQELRPYALPAAFASISWWLLLQITTNNAEKSSKSITTRDRKIKGLFIASTVAGLYSSYLYPFLIVGQLAFIIWKKQFKHFFIPLALSALLFLPWMPFFVEQLRVGGALRVALPGWDQVVSVPQWKALALVPAKFLFGVVELNLISVSTISIGSGLVAGLVLLRFLVRHPLEAIFTLKFLKLKSRSSKISTKLNLSHHTFTVNTAEAVVVAWFAIPFLSSWLVSWWVPVVSPKRLLFSLPAFYLMFLVIPWVRSRTILQQWLCMTLLCIQIAGLSLYWTQPIYQRENWRALEQEITADFPADSTAIVFGFTGPFAPWRWYHQPNVLASVSTGYLTNPTALSALPEKLETVSEKEYVLVFDYLRDLTDPTSAITQQLENMGYTGIGVIDYANIGFVRIYRKQPQPATGLAQE